MCIGVHDIVSFGDLSTNAEKSRHLILVTKTNIWCAKITVMAKWVTSILHYVCLKIDLIKLPR